MFSLIWRFIPGPAIVRIFVMLIVAAAIVWALITYVYPFAAQLLMTEEATVTS